MPAIHLGAATPGEGFAQPSLVVTMRGGGAMKRVVFGGEEGDAGTRTLYARVGGVDATFLVDREQVKACSTASSLEKLARGSKRAGESWMSSKPIDAKPIVKWAGGKSRLLGELLDRVPRRLQTYAEPFAGGAALFARVGVGTGARSFERAVLADRNDELVACYRAVKGSVKDVIGALASGRFLYDRDLFYEVRAQDTRAMSDVERAASNT